MKDNSKSVRTMVTVGLMAALVFIFTYIRIEIPISITGGKTMLHLGNVMCILSALLFGKWKGGLAAGFGSMFFDLFDPLYLPECWVTFIMKFCLAFIVGLVAYGIDRKNGAEKKKPSNFRIAVGAVVGAFSYVVLYVSKTFIVDRLIMGYEPEVVYATMITKGSVSLINATIAAVASLLLLSAIRPALKKSELADKLGVM
ncbi:MAG: ECF transporter S component [Ruminococcaceae bacterium]|nr:ECF transporter S component [Oscillospiraceae bacterium]